MVRPSNLTWHEHVGGARRAVLQGQRPAVLWLTGLSASGKSTIAHELDKLLLASGHAVYVLDGDNVRKGLNEDLGFSAEDRAENVRRVGHVARLMVDAGLFVLVPLISPYRKDRDAVRSMLGSGQFLEVYVNASVETCEARDPKGLYAKARAGQIQDFTGISAPYEAPLRPEIEVHSRDAAAVEHAQTIHRFLAEHGHFESPVETSADGDSRINDEKPQLFAELSASGWVTGLVALATAAAGSFTLGFVMARKWRC